MKKWLSVLGLAFSISACSESRAPCSVPTWTFFAKYSLTKQTGACEVFLWNEVALEKYSSGPPGALDTSAHKWELGLQTASMGNLASGPGVSPEMVRAFSIGEFQQYADEQGLCRVDVFEPAEANIPERVVDLGVGSAPETLPPIHIREQWENLAMYNAPDVQATRFSADLTITDFESGCETEYSVSALTPMVYCGSEVFDPATGTSSYGPNDSLCSPRPRQEAEYYVGSGIDARIKTHCDPATLYCVLDGLPLDPL